MGQGPLSLPELTVVAIDTVEPALLKLALEDTLREIDPGEVLVFSDTDPGVSGVIWFHEEPRSYQAVAELLWHEVPGWLQTSHMLVIQWDSWVLNGDHWMPEWLDLDYIGAPWGWHGDGLEVGNGGFSLRSRDLARWVAAQPAHYPLAHPEDVALCRSYRRQLEIDGFRWASTHQAGLFAFERSQPEHTFGFHGAWNWPAVLERDRLSQRLQLASSHARGKVEWQQLMQIVAKSAPSLLLATETR